MIQVCQQLARLYLININAVKMGLTTPSNDVTSNLLFLQSWDLDTVSSATSRGIFIFNDFVMFNYLINYLLKNPPSTSTSRGCRNCRHSVFSWHVTWPPSHLHSSHAPSENTSFASCRDYKSQLGEEFALTIPTVIIDVLGQRGTK